ncbi:MAG: NAD-dependent epimerase/dehydratase family protein [Acidimicrobiales bacterium]
MITGAAGFIGSNLSRRLLGLGSEVVGIDCFTDSYDPSEKLSRAAGLAMHPAYTHVAGDLVDLPLAAHLEGATAVFHLAGRPGVRPSFDIEDRYRHDNVEATHRLLDACQQVSSVERLVYASSSSVYGDADLPLREDGAIAPISPYGRTKAEAESACIAANGELLATVALRYFTVYGPGQRPDMAFRRFCEAAVTEQPIELLGDGSQSRDFTFIDDVVDATLKALGAPAGAVINVGGGTRVTLSGVLDHIERLVGPPLRVDRRAAGRGDVKHTLASQERAREWLGFQARVPLEEGLSRELDWVRERLRGAAPLAQSPARQRWTA